MRSVVIAGIALSGVLGAGRPTPETGSGVQMLCVGTHHGDEVSAKSGAGWFGLYPGGRGFEIRPVSITVETVRDKISDQEGQMTAKKVTASEPGQPLILVRGIAKLARGSLPTFIAAPRFFFPGEHGEWQTSKGVFYELSAYGNAERPPDSQSDATRIHGYRLVFSCIPWDEQHKQVLVDAPRLDESKPPSVLWGGDLDGDGKMDLLMETGNHYNVTDLALYLSSRAGPGELVRLVARFRTVGC